MENILRKLEWQDGFSIPIANVENKELEKELQKLLLAKSKAKIAFDNSSTKINALKNHRKYILQEAEQTQKLLTAYKQQLDTEENRFTMLKIEYSRYKQDINQINKSIQDLHKNREFNKQTINKLIVKLDKIKTETNWDVEALNAWEESLKKRDDDNELLRKYFKEDESVYNILEAKRVLLEMELKNKLQALGKLLQDCNDYEIVIDRTGKIIRQLILERDNLIVQWKETVKILNARDNDVARMQQQLIDDEELIQNQTEIMEEQNNFLENEIKNNHKLELVLQDLNALNSKLRKDQMQSRETLDQLNNELYSSKKLMHNTAYRLETARQTTKKTYEKVERLKQKLVDMEKRNKALKEKLTHCSKKATTSTERSKELEFLIDSEERQEQILLTELQRLQFMIYKAGVNTTNLKTEAKNLKIQMQSLQSSTVTLNKHMRHQTVKKNRFTEIIYDLEYQLDMLNQKILMMEMMKNDHKVDEKERQIQELEINLERQVENKIALQKQLNRMREESLRQTNIFVEEKSKLEKLQQQCDDGLLTYELNLKQVTAIKEAVQQKQVDENLLALRINNLEKELKNESDNIFTLQKLQLSLEEAMKQRHIEISHTKDILLNKRRLLCEEKRRLKADIVVRQNKIEQYKKKYHIALMSLGKDEDGNILSITHFKVKNAQEKFFLQQEGDKLEAKVKKAEQEIVAMENTLKIVTTTNLAFKKSLSNIDEKDDEATEMKLLESSLQNALHKVTKLNKVLVQKQKDKQEIQRELALMVEKREEVLNQLTELEYEHNLIQKQVDDKQEKLNRARCMIKRMLKKVQGIDLTIYQKDLQIRHLKEANISVMKSFNRFLTDYPDMGPLINRFLSKYEIKLPSPQYSSTSSDSSILSMISSCSSTSMKTNNHNVSTRSSMTEITNINSIAKVDVKYDIGK